jgi:endonuclease/exonuclease/phosphatase family metal-dependent hydrolase
MLAPLIVLVPAAVAVRRRSVLLLFISGLVVLIPVMGFNIPWTNLTMRGSPGLRLRVLTCNVDQGQFDADSLSLLITEEQPDFVALQEWRPQAHALHALEQPQRWNGQPIGQLWTGSRYNIVAQEALRDDNGWRDLATRSVVETPAGSIQFFNVHLETPRKGIEPLLHERYRGIDAMKANLEARWKQSADVAAWIETFPGPQLIVGDLNMPVDSGIYGAYWNSFSNAYSEAGFGFGYTKFTRTIGVRVDHVLMGRGWRCQRCWLGRDVGSDHRPVLADIQWEGSPQ